MALKSDAIMFLPALLCDTRLYSNAVSHFRRELEVIVPEIFSHDSFADMAAEILASAPKRFALVGNSMGGYLALEIMAQAPQRVSHLALVGTNAHADTPPAREKREQAIRLAERGKFNQFVDGYVEGALTPAHRARLGPIIREMARDLGPGVLIRQQKTIMARADYRDLLKSVHVPSLVAVGREDGLSEIKHQHHMAGALSNSRFFEMPRCGHLVPLEAPELFNAAMEKLLSA
ncbi:alpha/beta fold hydrolase [Kordiimonas aestuarii]|uniref:alpha/beta fold hydrolase n=1 Tax=Kordiimonas aestuarii TaxID=1005925 RepID=UPI0021D19577|nr:alpha/beta hydrolase [Kordiimonas aestuarii]